MIELKVLYYPLQRLLALKIRFPANVSYLRRNICIRIRDTGIDLPQNVLWEICWGDNYMPIANLEEAFNQKTLIVIPKDQLHKIAQNI